MKKIIYSFYNLFRDSMYMLAILILIRLNPPKASEMLIVWGKVIRERERRYVGEQLKEIMIKEQKHAR